MVLGSKGKLNNQKGITLVALVVTILLLVILVSVTVKIAVDHGLIGNTEKVAESYEIAQARETLLMQLEGLKIKNIQEDIRNKQDTFDSLKHIDGKDEIVVDKDKETGEVVIKDDTVKVTVGDHEFIVDENLNIVEKPNKNPEDNTTNNTNTNNTTTDPGTEVAYYSIIYYKENLDGNGYTQAIKETKTGTIGSTVTVEEKEIEGFTLDKTNPSNNLADRVVSDGSLVLQAYYIRQSYTITLQAEEETHTITRKYEAPLGDLPKVAKEGYTFVGWQDEQGNLVTKDTKMPASNMTLTPRFTENQYTITLDNQDGTTTTKEVTYNSSYGELPTPEKEGYMFEGWYTQPNGAGNKVEAETKVTTASNHTLYANWKVNQYTLTVEPGTTTHTQDYNSSIEVTAPVQNYTVSFNTNGGVTLENIAVAREFTEWSLEGKGGLSSTTSNPTTFTFGAGDSKLTASYGNGRTTLPIPTKEGYTFEGWYSDETLTNKVETEYTVTGDITLYANWTTNQYTLTVEPGTTTHKQDYNSTIEVTAPVQNYIVSFNTNGGATLENIAVAREFTEWTLEGKGSLSSTTSNPTTFTFGAGDSKLTASYGNGKVILPTVEKEGYTFEGWYSDEELTTKVGNAGEEVTVTGDITLYAKYTANRNSYIVNYYQENLENENPNDKAGYTLVDTDTSRTALTEETVTITEEDKNKYAEGFDYNDTLSTKEVIINGVETAVLEVYYTRKNEIAYTINYHVQNIEGTGYDVKETKKQAGRYEKEAEVEQKTYEGYTYEKTESNKENNKIVVGLVIDVYYTRNANSVTVSVAPEKPAAENIAEITGARDYKYEEEVSLTATAKEGYVFKGWEVTSNNVTLTDEQLKNNTITFTMPAEEVTITAKFYKAEVVLKAGAKGEETESYLESNVLRNKIESIEFKSNYSEELPNNVVVQFDASEAQDGSIIGYYTDENSNNLYELTFASEGKILANENSSYLFYNLIQLNSIDLSGLDTKNVTNMDAMFMRCNKLTSLDLTNFNTTNVTDMSSMFKECSSLINLNIANLDTTNVTNMQRMFWECSNLSKLDVSNFNTINVTNMSCMFLSCGKLTSLDVSNFDTANVTNMSSVFMNCSRLTNLDLTNFDTTNVTNMNCMFDTCNALSELNVSNFNTANVTDMHSMFHSCNTLTKLNVSNFDTSKVTNMSFMFARCRNLSNLDISNFNTNNVTNMGAMFYEAYALTSLDLSNFNTANVTDMSSMFCSCRGLTSLKVNSFDTTNVTNMRTMFYGCSGLTELDVSNFDTSNVTNMQNMFYSCNKVSTLDLSGFNTINVINMGEMFRYCSKLEKIYVAPFDVATNKGWTVENVNTSTGLFTTCTSLVGQNGTRFDENYTDKTYANIDMQGTPGYLSTKGATLKQASNVVATGNYLESTVAKDKIESITFNDCATLNVPADAVAQFDASEAQNGSIVGYYTDSDSNDLYELTFVSNGKIMANENSNYLFQNLTALTSIDLADLDTSKVTNMRSMFYYCSKLTSLDVSHFDTTNVTNMESVFYGCNDLTSLDVSHFDTTNVKTMSTMFAYSSNLTSLDVSKFNTANVTNMNAMFHSCRGLTSLDVSNFDISNVTTMGNMFQACSGLTSLDVSKFNTANVTNMNNMFSGCSSLTSLDASNFDTTNARNMEAMFSNCSSLKSLDVSNFDTSNVTTMQWMFDSCNNLTSLDLSSFDTSNVTTMMRMFYHCSGLKTIYVLPFNSATSKGWTTDKVTNATNMFNGCEVLVGQNGTTYDENYLDKTYAKIDMNGDPGYLSTKGTSTLKVASNGTATTNYLGSTVAKNKIEAITFSRYTSLNVPETAVAQFDASEAQDGSIIGYYTDKDNNNLYELIFISTGRILANKDSSYLFQNLTNATNIDVRGLDTSNATNMSGMFAYCNALTNLDITGFNTENVTDMENMFLFCSKLTNLDVSHFNTANVTNMREMFDGCSNLTSLDLSNFNTEKVTNMLGMFWRCSKLENVDVSSFNTENVIAMSDMFDGCKSLTNIDLSNFNTQNVLQMDCMFDECRSLTTLDLSSFDTFNNQTTGCMFLNCENLVTIYVTEFDSNTNKGWTVAGLVESGNTLDMFNGCQALVGQNGTSYYDENIRDGEYARIDRKDTPGYLSTKDGVAILKQASNVASTGNYLGSTVAKNKIETITFNDCSTLNVPANATSSFDASQEQNGSIIGYYTDTNSNGLYELTFVSDKPIRANEDSSYLFQNLTSLTSIDLTDLDTSKTKKMNMMFYYCSKLPELDVSSLNTSNATEMASMFYGCEKLANLNVKKFDTSNVTTMASMFGWCTNLTSLDVRRFDTSNVTNMANMFINCKTLANLDVSHFSTEQVTTMREMFRACTNLTNLDLSNFNTSNVRDMLGVFWNCSNLENVNVSSFDTSNVTNMTDMFDSCYKLTELNISNFDTSNVTQMGCMFYNCRKLTSLDLSSFNTVNVENTGCMFDGCSKLVTIYVSKFDSNTNAGWSMNEDVYSLNMFSGCNALVGQNGTSYYETSMNDGEYARIDRKDTPGYLSIKDGVATLKQASNVASTGNYLGSTIAKNKIETITFDDCSTLNVPANATVQFDASQEQNRSIIGYYTDTNNNGLYELTFTSDKPIRANEDASFLFENLTNVTSIDLADLDTSNVISMNSMFYICSNLNSLDINNFNTAKVTDMSHMFQGCTKLKSLDLGNFNTAKVTDMSDMFWCCREMTSLNLNNFNTEKVTNMSHMFGLCNGLTNLDISNFSTAKVTEMGHMFQECSSLKELDLSNFNTENVVKMGSMFFACRNLTSLDLSNFNTKKTTEMYTMFYACDGLTILDISSFDTSNVINMANMFQSSKNLKTIYVTPFNSVTEKGWITDKVTDSVYMFYECNSLVGQNGTTYDSTKIDKTYARIDTKGTPGYLSTKDGVAILKQATNVASTGNYLGSTVAKDKIETITFNDCSTLNVPSTATAQFDASQEQNGSIIGYYTDANNNGLYELTLTSDKPIRTNEDSSYLFENLTNITSIDLADLDTSNTKNMNMLFYYCKKLENLNVSNFNTDNVTNMGGMFDDCKELTTLDLKGFNTSKVTNMATMFYECSNLETVDVSHFNTSNVTNIGSMFSGCNKLTNLDVSNFDTANVVYMNTMFNRCTGLTNIDVSHFNTSKVRAMNWMFANCTNLTQVDVSGFDTSNATDMSLMFVYCNKLAKVDVSHFDTSNVKSMRWMFLGCSSLTQLDVSKFNTANVTDMYSMFQGCSSLTQLDVSKFNTANVTDMNSMFQECSSLTQLDVSKFNTANVTNMTGMFNGCRGLTQLNVNNFNTVNVTNMARVFQSCEKLTYLDLSNFDTRNVTNMSHMFKGCSNLSTLNMAGYGNINTSKVTQMDGMFQECNSLRSLDLRGFNTASVTQMDYMFYNCNSLTGIYVRDYNTYNKTGWTTDKVTNSTNMFTGCTNLSGERGTKYSTSYQDKTRARIDQSGTPGYLRIVGYGWYY